MTSPLLPTCAADLSRAYLSTTYLYNDRRKCFIYASGAKRGLPAGIVDARGYHRLYIPALKNTVMTSNLLWLWFTGSMPAGKVSYADGNKSNVTINNLLVDGLPYNRHVLTQASRKSLHGRHVTQYKRTGKWRARIGTKHVGYFQSEEAAASELNAVIADGFIPLK